MNPKKKTINISKKLLSKIPLGITLSIVIVFLFHLFGNWEEIKDMTPPETGPNDVTITWTPKVTGFFLTCNIGSASHNIPLYNENYEDIKNKLNGFKILNSLKSTFNGHFLAIFLISIFATFLLYFLERFRFIVK